MAVRILHCGKNRRNYDICLNKKIAGFPMRLAEVGDLIYFALRLDSEKRTVTGARGILEQPTDRKPWEDGEKYVQCFTVKDMEYCKPFDVSELKRIVGNSWPVKYLQRSKPIHEEDSINLLDDLFTANRISTPIYLSDGDDVVDIEETGEQTPPDDVVTQELDDMETAEAETTQDEAIKIMGTF